MYKNRALVCMQSLYRQEQNYISLCKNPSSALSV